MNALYRQNYRENYRQNYRPRALPHLPAWLRSVWRWL
jgi:hypothetical protein